MPDREFQVEAENPLPDGFWPGEPIEVANRSELEALMLDAAAVLDRIGGTFSIVALRQELVDGEGRPTDLFVTTGFKGLWKSYAPARRAPQKAEAVPEPPLPEPPTPEPADLTADEIADHFPEEEQAADEDFGPDAEKALATAE